MITTKEALEDFTTDDWRAINSFIDEEFKGLPAPIYSSVDIRESKFKVAPVDHNMYPAGLNNICARDLEACSDELRKTLRAMGPYKTIGVLTESHTKNTFYLDHLAILGKMIRDAGVRVRFISFDKALFTAGHPSLSLLSHSKFDILIEKAFLSRGEVFTEEGKIDLILLNNDQSSPINIDWTSLAIPVAPTPRAGWFRREKVQYFSHYARVAQKFAQHFNIDPDLLQAKFTGVENVNFSTKEGMDQLAVTVDAFRTHLPEDGRIFVKASRGTYGMGISVVRDGEDIRQMNRRHRNKMDMGKNRIKFTSLLIQEGIETILEHEGMPAEVAIYLINTQALGGFMRANGQRSTRANLNARGMVFKKYCLSEIKENDQAKRKEALYSVVARLATLAAAWETKEITEQGIVS